MVPPQETSHQLGAMPDTCVPIGNGSEWARGWGMRLAGLKERTERSEMLDLSPDCGPVCQSVKIAFATGHGCVYTIYQNLLWSANKETQLSCRHIFCSNFIYLTRAGSLPLENEAGAGVITGQIFSSQWSEWELSPPCYLPKEQGINALVRQLVSFCGCEFNVSQLHSTHPSSGLSFKNEFSLH